MPEPEAAVAILRARAPEPSVLLMRRAEREGDPWSGHWSFPGGRCEPQDTGPLETALRELEEECGIRLSPDRLESAMAHSLARRRVGRYLLVAPFIFDVESQLPTVLDHEEAVDALWIPIRILTDPARHSLLPVPGRGGEVLFPGIALPGAPLWGFTYRLITGWLQMSDGTGGAEAAAEVLKFLATRGVAIRQPWTDRKAIVAGAIPVEAVVRHFTSSDHFLPAINCLEIGPDAIRITGPEFEDYSIVVEQ